MNVRFMATVLAFGQLLISASPLFAQTQYSPINRAERRAYHACLYAHWIDGYCRFGAWGISDYSFSNCVIANGGCECVIANNEYVNWGPDVDYACRTLYRRHRYR
jgi:hypothetical protein